MNVLITGVDGYVGTLLGPLLMNKGYAVIGADAGFYRGGWLYNRLARFPLTVTADVRQITVEGLRGIDAVVHLAELSNDPLGALDPVVTRAVNLQGTLDFAMRCKSAGVRRFVYSSSCSVYGSNEALATEDTAPNPLTEYAACKVGAEERLVTLADESFSPVILRNATMYGPSPRMRFDLVVNRMAGMAWTIQRIEIPHDGSNWRPLVHVGDVCRLMAHALEAPREAVHNQIFNVVSENWQVKAIAQQVTAAFPACQMTVDEGNCDERSYRVDGTKLHEHLPQFEYRYRLKTGLRELHQLFKRIHLSTAEFARRPYTRLHQLQWLLDTRQLDPRLFWRGDV